MIDVKTRMAFLNRMHLFNQMGDEELAGIAHVLDEKNYGPEAVVFQRQDEPDGFYMVYSGRVKVTRPRNRGQDFLAWLVKGDYFGEEAMFQNRQRSATVTTDENTTLLFLSRNDFENLLKKYPQLKPNFQVAIKSRQLARQMRFKWLGAREVVYFIARRHYIKLIQALIAPVLFVVLPIFLFFWSFLTNAVTPGVVGVIVLIGTLLWGTWNVIDWSNDYYIVTNQRVIWLEKVIGIYDSRQEAPLSTVLSVGISTDMLGRAFDFGTVTVRTFVGKIVFDFVTYPDEAAAIVREHWERSKERGVYAQKEAMKNAIRAKLGLTVHTQAENEDVPVKVELPQPQKMSALRVVLANLFKLRVESGGTITYHKHWYVLLLQMWKPLAAILLLFVGGLWRTWDLRGRAGETVFSYVDGSFSVDTILLAIPIIMLPMIGWLVWEYVDWKNDIFLVTPDEIFDIDKRPLGNEERRAAQLENILSTEYKRIGLAGYVLNFGTVYISVGGTTMAFEDVMDPAGVQADIDRRRMARMDSKREESAKQDRERMATWIAAYHNNIDEFNAPPPPLPPLDGGEEKSG